MDLFGISRQHFCYLVSYLGFMIYLFIDILLNLKKKIDLKETVENGGDNQEIEALFHRLYGLTMKYDHIIHLMGQKNYFTVIFHLKKFNSIAFYKNGKMALSSKKPTNIIFSIIQLDRNLIRPMLAYILWDFSIDHFITGTGFIPYLCIAGIIFASIVLGQFVANITHVLKYRLGI